MPSTNLIRWSVWRDFCCHRNCSPKKVVVLSLELPKSPENPKIFDNFSCVWQLCQKLSDVFAACQMAAIFFYELASHVNIYVKVPMIYCWWLRNPIPNHRKDVETNPVDNEIFTIYQQYLHLSRDPWPMLYLSRSSLPPKFGSVQLWFGEVRRGGECRERFGQTWWNMGYSPYETL